MEQQLTDKDFDVLHYHSPADTPQVYADQALTVLKNLEQLNPRLLPYFLAANTVLTLSGVRAFDTYLSFETLDETEIQAALEFLESSGLTLFSHLSEYDDSDKDTFSLVHHTALVQTSNQYRFDAWFPPHPPFNFDRLLAWTYSVEFKISQTIADNKLPKVWSNDSWAAHNIRFGILLGYPGEAIAGSCWAQARYLDDGNELPRSDAKIAHHDAYDAAWPVYNFLIEQKDTPNIVNHQKLWSDILTRVYESDWHQTYKKLYPKPLGNLKYA